MNMIADITAHARKRMQQRAVPQIVLELLERFGTWIRCNGMDRIIFDKKAVRRLRRHLGGDRGLAVIERWLGVYAVVNSDGALVTVAHRTGRHWRS